MRFRVVALTVVVCSLVGGDGAAANEKNPLALAEGRNGVVVGTTGPLAVHAGLEILKKGGSAADAVMATSLAQVVECGGAYVSHAGILSMVYYDAATGKVFFLNACYNTPLEEKDPGTIPALGEPSGRTALVPGFMAGVQAAHDRFGKLPRMTVFEPALAMAEKGFKVSPMLARFVDTRKSVLSRLPETRRVFSKEDGTFYAEGDLFKQPELAKTLGQIAEKAAAFMYTGDWAEEFVAAVQKEGGKINLDDMKAYQVIWEEPLQTNYRDHQVYLPGPSSLGGVAMLEALNLLEKADLPRLGNYTTTPASLFWLMQISHCHVLSFLPDQTLKNFQGLDLTAPSRVKKETVAAIWQLMQEGKWYFASQFHKDGDAPGHSDGVVVVDRWGNMAAVTHSINTTLWGNTGIFVGGISIPDSAVFQRDAIGRAGPGKRLPDPMCPLIVFKDGKPVLGSSAIGGGLHARSLQVLVGFLDFGLDPQIAVEAPAFMLAEFPVGKPIARVEEGQFDRKLLDGVEALGQKIKELSQQESAGHRGYWVGVHVDPKDNLRRGVGTRKAPFPSVSEGY